MEFLRRLVQLERLVEKLIPLISRRDGTYLGRVTNLLDPLSYGRVKALMNDGTESNWLWFACDTVIALDDAVLVNYTSGDDVGYVIGVVYPRMIERTVTPVGEVQPGLIEPFSSPRMSEFLEP